MAEEKPDNATTPTMDDLSVMRVLLHTIKGISTVSTIPELATYEDSPDSAA